MKKIISTLVAALIGSVLHAQSSFSLPGNGNWYKVADVGGQHGYLEYIYSQATGNSPSIAKGEIQFINSMNYTVQHHSTMGYSAWNQPQFALLNLTSSAELWVKATNGVATGTFRITSSLNANVADGSITDSNLADNGGTLKIYDKLTDGAHTFVGAIKADIINSGWVSSTALEMGGANPSSNSGQATLFLHHYGVIAHQLRYSNASLYLESAGNGYGTNSTPQFFVAGNIGIGTTDTKGYKLAVAGKAVAEELNIKLQGSWPDYVFEPTYTLPALDAVQSYINQNKHLPEVPSAKEMEANGVNLGEMNMLLLKKVEELTLYVIELNKKSEKSESDNNELRKRILYMEKNLK